MSDLNKCVIYTDGSCLKNPGGPGGWGFVLFEARIEWHVSGGEKETTNNRMELSAVIEALKFSEGMKKKPDSYMIYSDSTYVINCGKRIWKRTKNTDLWTVFDKVSENKKIEWIWVKGHNGDKYNEIVDVLAKEEAISYKE